MKKIFLFIVCEICLFVSLLSFKINDNNGYVRNVVISEKYSYDYYNEKYGLENNDSSYITMEEIYCASDFNLKKTSSDDDIVVSLKLVVDKVDKVVNAIFLIYNDGELVNEVINNYYINIENDKIVVTTSFDTTFELEELLEYYGIVKKCAGFSMVCDGTYFNPNNTYLGPAGGGGGIGSSVAGAIGGALGAGLLFASSSGNSSSNGSTISVIGESASGAPNPNNNNNKKKKTDVEKTKELSDEVPDEYKQNYQCDKYANSLEEKMKANNISGEKIEVTSSGKYCISDENGMISKNGKHWAIKVNDTVFDNLHPNGIPYAEWYEDLGGEVYNFYNITEAW